MNNQFVVFALMMLSIVPVARAQDDAYQIQCRALATIPIPPEDIRPAPGGCDSNQLYYGVDGNGRGADFIAARACAYRERAAKDDGQFSGAMILTMVYANGLGVSRNIPLAKRFACELDGAPAEMDGRLAHLDAIGKGKPDKGRFDICDDITSGYMMGVCSEEAADFAKVRREDRLRAIVRTWTPAQQASFAALRKAADAFFDASSDGEIDQTGTARGALVTEAREALADGFLTALEGFEKGLVPKPGPAALKAEDAGLNTAYKTRLAEIAKAEKDGEKGPGSVTAAGVRDAQRKWLVYREAWVKLGATRYPTVPADAWRAWLSHQRAELIRNPEPDQEGRATP